MSGHMLLAKPMDILQKERQEREKSMTSQGGCTSFGMNRTPLGKGQGRFDFEELENAELDEYRFQIEIEV